MKKITWELKVKTVSEANCSEHFQIKSKRHKGQQFFIRSRFSQEKEPILLPCIVILTRLSPRFLDDDNLLMSFKWIRDEISECLIPEKIKFYSKKGKLRKLKGRADCDPRIKWQYLQEKADIQGIRIEFVFEFGDTPLDIGHVDI